MANTIDDLWAKYHLQIIGKFILHKHFCVITPSKLLCLLCFNDPQISDSFNCCDKQLIIDFPLTENLIIWI